LSIIDTLHLREPYDALMAKVVPKHRSSMFYYMGGLALLFFIIQVITGVLLLFYYQPTPEAAHQSVELIVKKVPFGDVIRSVHSWSANALIAVVFIHMFSTFFMKSYRSPREIMWLTGIVLLLLMLGFGFTGYLLPWDDTAYFATRIGTEIPKAVPIFGDIVSGLLRGSKNVTGATLTRLFGLHVGVLPMLAIVFVGVHVTLTALFSSSVPPGVQPKKATRFISDYLWGEAIVWLIGLGVLLIVAVVYPWGLGPAYDLTKPTEPPAGVHPEWYFMFLFQTLKYIPEWVAVLFYTIVLLFWAAVPWLDRRAKRGERSPLFTAIGALAIAGMIALTALAYFSVAEEKAAADTLEKVDAGQVTH
jgi:cytochrome b6